MYICVKDKEIYFTVYMNLKRARGHVAGVVSCSVADSCGSGEPCAWRWSSPLHPSSGNSNSLIVN